MEIVEALSVFFVGAIILAPVAAVSARFAMKPVLSLLSRKFAAEDLKVELSAQAQRIEVLENELTEMHDSLRALSAAAEFDRRLTTPGPMGPGKAAPTTGR